MPELAALDLAPHLTQAVAVAQAYHERSKHRLDGYAAGPETLDWDAQPDPFRRYAGAPLTALPLPADGVATPWAELFVPGRIAPRALDRDAIGLLFELSFALSAWKQYGPDRWAMRVNPSSGNLHPTEAWLVCQGAEGVNDGVHHYAAHEHALEQRAGFAPREDADKSPARALIALTSIQWREAWKYGERAFRYCQLDVGHAVGALRYAAAVLGWRLQAVACSTAQLAALLGLDRDGDFGGAEREEPDLLLELQAHDAPAQTTAQWSWPLPTDWLGTPNRLDRHPMYRWPVVDAVAVATRVHAVPPSLGGRAFCAGQGGARAAGGAEIRGSETASAGLDGLKSRSLWLRHVHGAERSAAQTLPDLPRSTHNAATLIRQRRSAQRFDARARLPLAQLWPLLRALHPARLPFDAGPEQPRVHVLLFAHRVDGLAPGAYLLPRSEAGGALLRQSLPATLDLRPVPDAPADATLLRLAENPALAGSLRTLNCHQALGSDAILGFALLAEFNPLPDAASYRERLQEAGLIGQALYLEAEAMELRGTGIGCFFDDALHQLIGLPESTAASAPLQSVYHFTVGRPVSDARIATEPPYAHLLPTCCPPEKEPPMTENRFQRLQPAQARAWLAARPNALLLDAREARHHANSHLAGSTRLDGRNHEPLLLRESKGRPVLIYCYHGHASQTWASMFTDFGFTDVADLIGGWTAIDRQGQLHGPQQAADVLPAPAATAPIAGAPASPAAPVVPPALAAWLGTEGFNPSRPEAPGQHGNTPLMHAAWRGQAAMVEALLTLNVPLDAVNHDGNNALWLACVNGEPALIRTLVAKGVPIDHANLVDATALMYAASSGKHVVVATLLDLGADPHLVSQDDFSALDMAASVECLRLLRAATRRETRLESSASPTEPCATPA